MFGRLAMGFANVWASRYGIRSCSGRLAMGFANVRAGTVLVQAAVLGNSSAAARYAAYASKARPKPSSLKVRFLPDLQYLLALASGVWLLGCGVLASRGA